MILLLHKLYLKNTIFKFNLFTEVSFISPPFIKLVTALQISIHTVFFTEKKEKY